MLSYALMAWAIAYGAWRGGTPERMIAAILAAMFGFDRAGHLILAADGDSVDRLHVVVDAVTLFAMSGVAIEARRWWPLWALASQTLSLLADLSGITEQSLPTFAVVAVSVALYYPIPVALICGTWTHRQRLRTVGRDRPWRDSSP